MKTKLLLILLLTSQLAFTQRNSLSVGYGVVTIDQITSSFATAISGAFTGASTTNIKSTGAISLTYHRFHTSKRVGFGVAFVYDRLTADIENSSGTKISSSTTQALTLAAEGKFKYNKGEKFNIYGLLGAGYTLGKVNYDPPPSSGDDNNDYNHFNFQVTPAGLQYGGAVKGFLELGIGYKGILHGGVQFNF